ncbi:integrase/recombinase XerD [Paenibacillus sp. V4I3]|uniref:tyrosine-type recombinase/integrase n=1 Tax=Paenibacillus sp. V4I3 TaxID=3042305 RepID=UPI0027881C34|nr:tyrosine-type recombinase/integrase [Paenibacillus sp. V4I3]MDQ0876602.1 integrase/recombinase XerD [Paenibacillus sp. V4I3]
MVKVQEVLVPTDYGENKTRYMLLYTDGSPVIPVIKYLKYLDRSEKSTNTIKSYCYHLKLFFEFLMQNDKDYQDVSLDLLSDFMQWLRTPYESINVVPMQEIPAKRVENTINVIITCVVSFYDYLERSEIFSNEIVEKVTRKVSGHRRSFKSFLHHINKSNPIDINILKIKVPRRMVKTLTSAQIECIKNACSNIRDLLLLSVLYEGGLRISEALSLYIENFDIGTNSIVVRESKTPAGEGRRVYVTENTINLFQDFLIEYHADDIDTNYVFFKLRGDNKGQPLDYSTASSWVKRMKKKTGIDFTPHLFRHSYATELHRNGVSIKAIQELLGHRHVQTTMDMYLHPSDEDVRAEYDKAATKKRESLHVERTKHFDKE